MAKGKSYWRDRAEADMDAVQDMAGKRIDRIGRAYRQAARELDEQVDKIIGTYAKRFGLTRAEAVAALKQPFDEDSRAYGYRMSRAEAIKAASRKEAEKLGALIERETGEQRRYTASESYRRACKALKDRGADMSFARPDTDGLLRSIGTSWKGGNYSDRVWRNTGTLADILSKEITAAYLSGKSNRVIARQITDTMGSSFRAAERLVRTETSYVNNQAALKSYAAAGIDEYEFLTAKDSRTCKICAKMDGKRFAVSEQEIGVNMPPMHPYCRCTVLPVVDSALDGLSDEERRQWVADGSPEDVAGWLQKQPAKAALKFLNRTDRLYNNAKNITPIDGYEDVVCHADKYGFCYRYSDGKEENLSVHEFAEILRQTGEYTKRPIRLIACEAGADGAITAQGLADELGVIVLAPTGMVNVYPDGEMKVLTTQEEWRIFKPRK